MLHMVLLTVLLIVQTGSMKLRHQPLFPASTSSPYSFSHILLARNSITMRRMSTHRA